MVWSPPLGPHSAASDTLEQRGPGSVWTGSPLKAAAGFILPRMQARAQLARAGARGMLVDLNLDQFSTNCFSPGQTSQYLKAWSSRAHRNLKGQGGRAPCLEEGPTQRAAHRPGRQAWGQIYPLPPPGGAETQA